jgi:hypothetical protein
MAKPHSPRRANTTCVEHGLPFTEHELHQVNLVVNPSRIAELF